MPASNPSKSSRSPRQGVFVGHIGIDLIYLSPEALSSNQKLAALDWAIAAGGPATNAAVTFAYLGDRPVLVGSLGHHPLTELARTDLNDRGVILTDLDADRAEPPPISSIVVNQENGDRSVISLNAAKSQLSADRCPDTLLDDAAIVLIDGHQMALSVAVAKTARSRQIPVAIDGGSWKPGFDRVLPFVDYAVCSADFFPPGCRDRADVFDFLTQFGIANIAITDGPRPIEVLNRGDRHSVNVPSVEAIDTLGAGDIFHGAFCHFIGDREFREALSGAAEVAARSCQFFGTRSWMSFQRTTTNIIP